MPHSKKTWRYKTLSELQSAINEDQKSGYYGCAGVLVRLHADFVRRIFSLAKDVRLRITPCPGDVIQPAMAIFACRLEEVTDPDDVRVSSRELLNTIYVDLEKNWHVYILLPNRKVVAVELSCGNYVTTLCRRNLTDQEARQKAEPYYMGDMKIAGGGGDDHTNADVLEAMAYTGERYMANKAGLVAAGPKEKDGGEGASSADLLSVLSSFLDNDDKKKRKRKRGERVDEEDEDNFAQKIAEESQALQYGLAEERREEIRRQACQNMNQYDVYVDAGAKEGDPCAKKLRKKLDQARDTDQRSPDVGVKDLLAVKHMATTLNAHIEELYATGSSSTTLRHCPNSMVSAVVWVNRTNWLRVIGEQTPTVASVFIPPTPKALGITRRRVSLDMFVNKLLVNFLHNYQVENVPSPKGTYFLQPFLDENDEAVRNKDLSLIGTLLLTLENRVRVNRVVPPVVEFATSGTFFTTNYLSDKLVEYTDYDPRLSAVFCRAMSKHFKFSLTFSEKILSYDPLRRQEEEEAELNVLWYLTANDYRSGKMVLAPRVVDVDKIKDIEAKCRDVGQRMRAGLRHVHVKAGQYKETVRHVGTLMKDSHRFVHAVVRRQNDVVVMLLSSPMLSSQYRVTFRKNEAFMAAAETLDEFAIYMSCL